MVVQVPTEVIPIWYIEKWVRETADNNSALQHWIETMISDWKSEEIIQQEKHIVYRSS